MLPNKTSSIVTEMNMATEIVRVRTNRIVEPISPVIGGERHFATEKQKCFNESSNTASSS